MNNLIIIKYYFWEAAGFGVSTISGRQKISWCNTSQDKIDDIFLIQEEKEIKS
jgi:hypothetical protein